MTPTATLSPSALLALGYSAAFVSQVTAAERLPDGRLSLEVMVEGQAFVIVHPEDVTALNSDFCAFVWAQETVRTPVRKVRETAGVGG